MSAKPCKTRVFEKSCSLLPPFLLTVTPHFAHSYPPFCSQLPPPFFLKALQSGSSKKPISCRGLFQKTLNAGSLLPPLFLIFQFVGFRKNHFLGSGRKVKNACSVRAVFVHFLLYSSGALLQFWGFRVLPNKAYFEKAYIYALLAK